MKSIRPYLIVTTSIHLLLATSPVLATDLKAEYDKKLKTFHYQPVKDACNNCQLVWKFTDAKAYTYSYRQQLVNTTNIRLVGTDKGPIDSNQNADFTGVLDIISTEPNHIKLELKNLSGNMLMEIPTGEKKQMTQKMPPMVIEGLTADGTNMKTQAGEAFLYLALFPVSKETLKPGKTIEIPMAMPFNAGNTNLLVKGKADVTLSQMVKMTKCQCAQVDVKINLNQLEVPKELNGEYSFAASGYSRLFYDVNKGKYIEGVMYLDMSMAMDVKIPKQQASQLKAKKIPERAQMKMHNQNLYYLELQ
ncbi:MAG: hypothetical protein R3240_10150 [Gammaproteobacteria bacterium]|nr:hypothetical protein [Gammaproteobacteria bacterium]